MRGFMKCNQHGARSVINLWNGMKPGSLQPWQEHSSGNREGVGPRNPDSCNYRNCNFLVPDRGRALITDEDDSEGEAVAVKDTDAF